jgi:hypothetical protein
MGKRVEVIAFLMDDSEQDGISDKISTLLASQQVWAKGGLSA